MACGGRRLNDIAEIVLGVLAGVGGIGGIIIAGIKLYDEYTKKLKLCKQQLNAFERRWNISYLSSHKEEFTTEEYKRTDEINQKFLEVNNKIRRYIGKLDVLE